MRDQAIRTGVEEKLSSALGQEASGIGVAAHEGVVTLSGTVSRLELKRQADQIAQHAPGVRAVANEVNVRPPAARAPSDAHLARLILAAIENELDLAPGRVWVSVNQGWVYLEGELDTEDQRQTAQRTVLSVEGVRGVTNQIRASQGGSYCHLNIGS